MFRRVFNKLFAYDAKKARDSAFYGGGLGMALGSGIGVGGFYLKYTNDYYNDKSNTKLIFDAIIDPFSSGTTVGAASYIGALFYPISNIALIAGLVNGAGVYAYNRYLKNKEKTTKEQYR